MGFIDAEEVAVSLLSEKLDVPVYRIPPKDIPRSFIRVSRVGGITRNIVTDSALMSFSAYAKSPLEASKLANDMRAALWDSRASQAGGAWIRWWREVSGPVYYAQTDVDRFRYQLTGELRLSIS